jgi:peptide/nickel transport system substrate-binding protein
MWDYYTHDTFIRTKEDMSFGPGIADSWSVSDNGCVWTFKIHEGITFSNGDPLTAEDVKYSVDRFGSPMSFSAWSPYLGENYNKLGSRVVNDYTFEYSTAYPEATLLACFQATLIFDKKEVDRVGEELYYTSGYCVGSGHWIFKDLISKTKLTLEANTNYWIPEEVPAFQYWVELCVPEEATRINMFKTGELDILYTDDYARLKQLEGEGYPIIQAGMPGTDSFAFQATWYPEAGATSDIRIRQAMSYALNRQEICDTWYQGYAKPGGQFFYATGVFGWTDAMVADPYDPDLAKQLIADAGYPDAFDNPVITVFCDPTQQDRLLLYASYWEAVGLQIHLEVIDLMSYYGYLFQRPKPGDTNVGWIWFWKSWGWPNATYHSANMYTSMGVHGTANDPIADAMYQEITHQTDYNIAAEKMTAFQLYVKTLYINIGVVEYYQYFLYNPDTIGAWLGHNWDGLWGANWGIQHP